MESESGLFVSEVERFLQTHGMRKTTFGKQAVGDPGFVQGIRKGRSVRLSTVDRVRDFMRSFPEGGHHD